MLGIIVGGYLKFMQSTGARQKLESEYKSTSSGQKTTDELLKSYKKYPDMYMKRAYARVISG